MRGFRSEGFYERFPAKGQIERVARMRRADAAAGARQVVGDDHLHLARAHLVIGRAGIANPVGEAVPAEACKAHQVDVLCIVPMPQMADKAPESGGGQRIVQRIEWIGIAIHRGFSLS